jgi:hypothetical protein
MNCQPHGDGAANDLRLKGWRPTKSHWVITNLPFQLGFGVDPFSAPFDDQSVWPQTDPTSRSRVKVCMHRMGSLMEEEANLGEHAKHVCSCLDVVAALARQGQLTQAEEQRARSYLKLREKPWPSPMTIGPGAVLYLDGLSVTYLQHLRLLRKILGELVALGFIEITERGRAGNAEWRSPNKFRLTYRTKDRPAPHRW